MRLKKNLTKDKTLIIRVDKQTLKDVQMLAKSSGISVGEVVRQAISILVEEKIKYESKDKIPL
jgi:predicted HicB family RNase H-like nuclease